MKIHSMAVAAALFVCACGGTQNAGIEVTDMQVQALFSVPASDVSCIQITASAARTSVSKKFGVTPGQGTAALLLTGIPTGKVLFSGQAFAEPCAQAFTITWVAEDVSAIVTPAFTASVTLTFRASGSATVGGNFVGDDYVVTTIAGAAGSQGSVDAQGAFARLQGPNALTMIGNKLYFVDRNLSNVAGFVGMTVRSLDLTSNQVTTLAGNPNEVGALDGDGLNARFQTLRGIAASGGNLYLIDRCAIRVMSTTPPFHVGTLIGTPNANNTAWLCGGASPFTSNLLDIVARPSGIFVADGGQFAVYRVDPVSHAVTLVAGTPGVSGADDSLDSPLTATFLSPTGLVFPFSDDDTFVVADGDLTANTNLIRGASPFGVTTVAGGMSATFASVDGQGMNARFAQLRRMASDGKSLFVGDIFGVHRFDLQTSVSVTIAGSQTETGSADGVGTAARFNAAFGIVRDAATGALYVADQGNFTIRKLTPQ